MPEGLKLFCFFFVPKTLCRCWRQQKSRRSVEDCLRKRSGNKENQIFGGFLSFGRSVIYLRLSVMFG